MAQRIAINGLSVNSQPSGGKTYLLNLLEELTTIAGDDYQFYLLCSKRTTSIFSEKVTSPNVHLIAVPTLTANPLVRITVEQLFLPVWLWYNRIDLLFAARNVMPLLATCHTVIGIHSMHLNYENKNLPWWRQLYGPLILRASAKRAAAYLAVSEYAGHTYMEKYGLGSKRLFISLEGFKQKEAGNGHLKTNPVGLEYLLFVSTLFPHKNVPFLLRIFAQVAQIRSSTVLVIVGRDVDGSLLELKELAEELSISNRVHFLGAVTDDELMQLYASAHIFVFPSLVEGFGLTVLEAMAHSVPVVVSNRTSIPEVVGDAGIVLDPDNEGAWVEAILQILENNQLHQELSLRASNRAKMFTWRHAAEATLDCFHTVLSTSGKRR